MVFNPLVMGFVTSDTPISRPARTFPAQQTVKPTETWFVIDVHTQLAHNVHSVGNNIRDLLFLVATTVALSIVKTWLLERGNLNTVTSTSRHNVDLLLSWASIIPFVSGNKRR